MVITPLTQAQEDEARSANDGRDLLVRWHGQADKSVASYFGDAPPTDPLVSPPRADWHDFDVRTLITTGSSTSVGATITRAHQIATNPTRPDQDTDGSVELQESAARAG